MSDETKASATVSDYLRWRGDLTFAQDGFNEVDNLLLCIISYIKLENIPRLRSLAAASCMESASMSISVPDLPGAAAIYL